MSAQPPLNSGRVGQAITDFGMVSLSGGKNVCTLLGILRLLRDREQDHPNRTGTIFAVLRNPDPQRLASVSRFDFTVPGCNS
ncbi:MAG: hypothetical protein DRR03_05120 [Gammaproteobacteria bacterium]|nr:MAG: hypothetical protein DRR03_05120 [Gammaproteobacteria bacterium]